MPAKHRADGIAFTFMVRYYRRRFALTCANAQRYARMFLGRSATVSGFLIPLCSPLLSSLTDRQLKKDRMALCLKCGIEDNTGYITKRVNRGSEQLCSSCAARPAKLVTTAYGKCRPWHGDFDEWENPLNKYGELYRPGLRLCGYRDCIEKTHIQTKK